MKFNYLKLFFVAALAVLFSGASARADEMDDRIEASVNKSYVFKTYLKDNNIKTESRDGVVTLTGTVNDQSHKALAQETVASLSGVKRVDNQLELSGDVPEESSDAWMSMQVKYLLLYNRNVSGMKTQVFVTDGIVTLRGEAGNQAQKDLAGEYAKDVKGVKQVNNEMTIAKMENAPNQTLGEKIDDASITAQIKMALLSHQSTSAFKTGVNTDDGVVTLSGRTTTAAGKAMVGKVAGDVNGVKNVINNLIVEDTITKN